MPTVRQLADYLEEFAPARLAESWDNVGLLVGDGDWVVERVMTCLTITPASAREAIDEGANLIVAHHPLPFRPLKQLTAATPEGRILLDLIAARIAIYSPHTAFDSAAEGINARLAAGLNLQDIDVLVPAVDGTLGAGRFGTVSAGLTLHELAECAKTFLAVSQVHIVGAPDAPLTKVAVACGSAGDFLAPARARGCDCLVTGEVRFHTAVEAEATGIALVIAGHFASERFGVEALAKVLAKKFPELRVWASQQERDPIAVV